MRIKGLLVGSLVALVGLVGCGTGVDGAGQPDPLEVTDQLRAACYGFLGADADIRGMLIALQLDKENGMTKTQALSGGINVCYALGLPFACLPCSAATVEHIYGAQ